MNDRLAPGAVTDPLVIRIHAADDVVIARHQLVQDLLVKCIGNITASVGMVVRVSQMLDEGVQRDEHASLAKAFTTARMRETVAWAREVLGGNGILLENGVMQHMADIEAIHTYEGTESVQALLLGRDITGMSAFA